MNCGASSVWSVCLLAPLVAWLSQPGLAVAAPNVVAWGDNSNNELVVPADLTNAVAVAAGNFHSLALKADGTVVGWGGSYYGTAGVPTGLSLDFSPMN